MTTVTCFSVWVIEDVLYHVVSYTTPTLLIHFKLMNFRWSMSLLHIIIIHQSMRTNSVNYNLGAWLRWRNLHPRLPLHQIFLWCLRLNLSRIHAYRFQLRCSYLMLLGIPAVKKSYKRPSIL